MEGPAAEAPPRLRAEAVAALDGGVPLDSPEDYRSLLDWQVLAPEGELHPSVAALNDRLAAPAARAVQQAQGESQTLPNIIEAHFVPMLDVRRSLLVFEPRGQRREERQARKRQRSAAQCDDDVDYSGSNSYPGRYNFLPSGPEAVPIVIKRTATLSRKKGGVRHQFTAHEVRRAVPNPEAAELRVAGLQLEDSGVAELRLAAGGEAFSGSTKIVLVTGLPVARVAGKEVQLSGRYPVNPSGCGKLAQPGSHFRIKLPKRAAAAEAEGIRAAVQQGLVEVTEDYIAEESPILHHLMLSPAQPAQQPEAAAPALGPPALLLPALGAAPAMAQQQQQQQVVDALDPDGLLHQVLNGVYDVELLGDAAAAAAAAAGAGAGAGAGGEAGEQHYRLLTVGGEQPAAGRGAFAARSFVVQGDAAVTGELWAQGQMVVSDARMKESIRAFNEAEKSLSIVTDLCSYLFEYKGTGAPRVGLLAQQVLGVLKRHEAEGLNIVKADPQGSLAVDFAALQTLLASAIKQVHADTAELRQTQNAFQLMVMGRPETMAKTRQAAGGELEVLLRTDSGGSGGGGIGGTGTAGGSTAGGGTAGGSLPASPSLAQLLGPDDDYDMATSDNGEGSEEGEEADGEQPEEGELRGMSEQQAAAWLMSRLCEQAGAQKLYLKLAGDLSRAALWETYQAALAAPPEPTNDGSAQRTLGGIFIKLAKKSIQAEKMRQKAAAQGSGPVQLRGYQQRLVAVARRGGNHIFVAPTNSGKTAVALEHAAYMLGKDSKARVVFVAPTVALATQQGRGVIGEAPAGQLGQETTQLLSPLGLRPQLVQRLTSRSRPLETLQGTSAAAAVAASDRRSRSRPLHTMADPEQDYLSLPLNYQGSEFEEGQLPSHPPLNAPSQSQGSRCVEVASEQQADSKPAKRKHRGGRGKGGQRPSAAPAPSAGAKRPAGAAADERPAKRAALSPPPTKQAPKSGPPKQQQRAAPPSWPARSSPQQQHRQQQLQVLQRQREQRQQRAQQSAERSVALSLPAQPYCIPKRCPPPPLPAPTDAELAERTARQRQQELYARQRQVRTCEQGTQLSVQIGSLQHTAIASTQAAAASAEALSKVQAENTKLSNELSSLRQQKAESDAQCAELYGFYRREKQQREEAEQKAANFEALLLEAQCGYQPSDAAFEPSSGGDD